MSDSLLDRCTATCEDAIMSYVIARLSDDGQAWETLQAFKSYEAADRGLDGLSDRYPDAWLEIIPAAGASGPELLLEMLEMR